MAVVLFDTDARSRLYPFTYTKAIAHFYFGMLTIQQRWHLLLNEVAYVETAPYLQGLYEMVPNEMHTWINTQVLPFDDIVQKIKMMQQGDVLEDENGIIACKGTGNNLNDVLEQSAIHFTNINGAKWLFYPHQILQWNKHFITFDFELLTKNKTSQIASKTNQLIASENIFIEDGASVECSVINASEGFVFIDKGAVVMEGSLLRGPLFLGEKSVVKMGCKIYGATSVAHHCTVGGEIKNVVMQPFSNKAHDGYLGDSVIGEWCNLGAGTSNSNVKNTGGDIFLPDGFEKNKINAGNKCGVMMGDYTRVAINSSINTGSVYGVCCNIFGEGLLPKRLRNFSWGVSGEGYTIEKAVQHITQWKGFKQNQLSAEDEFVLKYIFDQFTIV
ncbi:MAG: glucose-1-phosphate thymidylyltransferase [Bacteroidota bacterium]|nr:glucose-1-phosphate thymidylyltransferase [Bacteroidota bacterium]